MPPTLLTLSPPAVGWVTRAACAGLWDLMQSTDARAIEAAKGVCHSCPVQRRCLSWTLSLPPREDVAGVAGGMTETERERARRKIRRSRPPAPVTTKECRRCHEKKPVGSFYLRPGRADGRDSYCRSCCVDISRERRAAKKKAEAVTS